MAYDAKNRWFDYLFLGLSVFLIFCLVFESYVELPRLVAWLGRWHPIVLHFPIVLLLIALFMGLRGRPVPRSLLILAVLSALLTAISGFFLGTESGSKGELLTWHQWLGASVALLSVLWYLLDVAGLGLKLYAKVLQIVLVVLIGFTGHYGGMVTHGEEFLALPLDKKQKSIPENPLIFADVVYPILDQNCVSCHNPNKKKGSLLMTGWAALLKGGESGKTVLPGDADKSELIRRLHLPLDDEDHMPPDGKKPLGTEEIKILERWIALGASDTLRLDQLPASESLVSLVKTLMEPSPDEKWAKLPKVADSTLQNLASDYVTIERVSSHSQALRIDVYLSPKYDSKAITDLKRVASNIVELDLSGLPIGVDEMALVASCSNLEWLELDRTPIGDPEIEKLKNLKQLRLLKIYGTGIGDQSAAVLKQLENLKRLYLWETGFSEVALADLRLKMPNVLIDNGMDEETKAYFVASDTIAKTEVK